MKDIKIPNKSAPIQILHHILKFTHQYDKAGTKLLQALGSEEYTVE